MNRAMFASASGMAAQQRNLEVIADNLANSDVAGFKGAILDFTEVRTPSGESAGTSPADTRVDFSQGRLVQGAGSFDVAIDGNGFFCVRDAQNRRAFTRDGEFSRAADGTLRNADGWRLEGVRIPTGAGHVEVAADGRVSAVMPTGSRTCGRIRLAQFADSEGLMRNGGTIFFATRASGPPHEVKAGTPSGPNLRFGMLEQSNVPIVEAMMEILAAQRAYEANAKGVQAADEMMRIADNLSRA